MMSRKLLVSLLVSLAALLLVAFGCSAQTKTTSIPPNLDRSIERQVRAFFQLPEEIRMGARVRTERIPQL